MQFFKPHVKLDTCMLQCCKWIEPNNNAPDTYHLYIWIVLDAYSLGFCVLACCCENGARIMTLSAVLCHLFNQFP